MKWMASGGGYLDPVVRNFPPGIICVPYDSSLWDY
jgi:hypothetical protein